MNKKFKLDLSDFKKLDREALKFIKGSDGGSHVTFADFVFVSNDCIEVPEDCNKF